MHRLLAALSAASFLATGALAQPLSPGKPAGVKKARLDSTYETEMIGAGAAIMIAVGILTSGQSSVVNSNSFNGQPAVVPPVTTTPATTPSTVISTATTG